MVAEIKWVQVVSEGMDVVRIVVMILYMTVAEIKWVQVVSEGVEVVRIIVMLLDIIGEMGRGGSQW